MIYLDTHVLVYLSANVFKEMSPSIMDLIEESDDLFISPIVSLELQYLYEIKRIDRKPDFILEYLSNKIRLEICAKPFEAVIKSAFKIHWTRDPFDRIITATAALDADTLITGDRLIKKHYKHAVW